MTPDKNEAGRVTDERIAYLRSIARIHDVFSDDEDDMIASLLDELQRLRARDVEPRPLTCDDEWITARGTIANFHSYPTVESARAGMATAMCRLVRVATPPIPAAEPEEPMRESVADMLKRHGLPEPSEETKRERLDRETGKRVAEEPEEPKRPEPLAVGDLVRVRCCVGGPYAGRAGAIAESKERAWYVVLDGLPGAVLMFEPHELERLPAEPEPEDPDVARLKFCVGLGAELDASVNDLHRSMSLNRKTTQRRMAVEIARRRLAEMDAEKHPAEPEPASAEKPQSDNAGLLRFAEDLVYRAALRQIVETAPDAETIRRAAIALIGGGA